MKSEARLSLWNPPPATIPDGKRNLLDWPMRSMGLVLKRSDELFLILLAVERSCAGACSCPLTLTRIVEFPSINLGRQTMNSEFSVVTLKPTGLQHTPSDIRIQPRTIAPMQRSFSTFVAFCRGSSVVATSMALGSSMHIFEGLS
jgi:hypothetical protein